VELLLGDRPVWTHRRPIDPDFMVVVPMSPRSVFFAAKSERPIKKLIDAGASTVVRLVNESIVQQAQLRAYGRADVSFIDRCVRELGGLKSVVETDKN